MTTEDGDTKGDLREYMLGKIATAGQSPCIDLNPLGVDGLFPGDATDALLSILEEVRHRAVA